MTKNMVKITLPLDAKDWHGKGSETVWATPIDVSHFKIENTPFLAKEVSYKDTVETKVEGDERIFTRITNPGGHSTYRIIINKDVPPDKFEEYWAPLQAMRCTYESGGADLPLIAVDIPPETNIHEAYKKLEIGLNENIWSFEEGHVGHKI